MGDRTGIEWTDATWTPIRARNTATKAIGWHCEHMSEACRHCYAEGINLRLGTKLAFKPGHLDSGKIELYLDEAQLTQPLRWRRSRDIFVCSMTDLFGRFVPRAWIAKCFAVMALAQQHDFQVLTKRSNRMAELLDDPAFVNEVEKAMRELAPAGTHKIGLFGAGGWPIRNVMLGVSVEDQSQADERIPDLLATPAAVRFLSCEPLLGPVVIPSVIHRGKDGIWFDPLRRGSAGIGWIIAGGESGPRARPSHPDWFRSLRDQCTHARVPFFFKQWGEYGPDLEGESTCESCGRLALDVKVCDERCSRCGETEWLPPSKPVTSVARVGKKAAGALLDGREHREHAARWRRQEPA
jgi:protein gp37